MARIAGFERLSSRRHVVHPTETVLGYAIVELAGTRHLVLQSSGSEAREHPGKVSQTYQFDERAAQRLREILDEAFPSRPG